MLSLHPEPFTTRWLAAKIDDLFSVCSTLNAHKVVISWTRDLDDKFIHDMCSSIEAPTAVGVSEQLKEKLCGMEDEGVCSANRDSLKPTKYIRYPLVI